MAIISSVHLNTTSRYFWSVKPKHMWLFRVSLLVICDRPYADDKMTRQRERKNHNMLMRAVVMMMMRMTHNWKRFWLDFLFVQHKTYIHIRAQSFSSEHASAAMPVTRELEAATTKSIVISSGAMRKNPNRSTLMDVMYLWCKLFFYQG